MGRKDEWLNKLPVLLWDLDGEEGSILGAWLGRGGVLSFDAESELEITFNACMEEERRFDCFIN